MKYSFLFPYKNRRDQFHNTMLSLEHWYGHRVDWEAIVIVDEPDLGPIVPCLQDRVKVYPIFRAGDVNPAPLFNLAADLADGEFLVLSNPECYHVSDVLDWYDDTFKVDRNVYAVAACDHVSGVGKLLRYEDRPGVFKEIFQHSTKHNVLYHYCAAMSRENWALLGGFDDRFGAGYACEDDDFRDRVVCAGIRCCTDDYIKVLHQEHPKYQHNADIRRRYQHNLVLLRQGEAERGYKHDIKIYQQKGA